jgi:formate/nitrite transporter FocA (FNT family)
LGSHFRRLSCLHISGHTLLFDQLEEIPWRFPGIDLMLVHIGARLWAIVLVGNLAGIFIFCSIIGHTDIFSPEARKAFAELGFAAMQPGFVTILLKGIIAGWIIALVIWLLPAAETAGIWMIIFLTYLIGLGELSHVIAGSSSTFYLCATGQLAFGDYFLGFMIPTLIGNAVGGIAIAAAINHAQVIAGEE